MAHGLFLVFTHGLLLASAPPHVEPDAVTAQDKLSSADAQTGPDRNAERGGPWIRRYAPRAGGIHLGSFGGVAFPNAQLELFQADPAADAGGFKRLASVAPEVGVRVGYYPWTFVGAEVEGAGLPTSVDGGSRAFVWAVRGHIVARVPKLRLSPFVLAGPSALGVRSGAGAVGSDVDLGFHFGGGVEFFASRVVSLRAEVRDTLTAARGVGDGVVHTPELLFGVGLNFGGRTATPRVVVDDDLDDDGVLDVDDACVNVPGLPEYEGCPVPDRDGDRILEPDDACPEVPGIEDYDGCPVPDTDGDGIFDPQDKCPTEPEVYNGYQDPDGCPDEVPQALATAVVGVLDGITFRLDSATIHPDSEPTLRAAAKALLEFEDVTVRITGHTDNSGQHDYNVDLSRRRAEAVKGYLEAAGVAAARMTTKGLGETNPIRSNATPAGRATNRRIEFQLDEGVGTQ